MPSSRTSRLNPLLGSSPSDNLVDQQPLQYSNTIPESSPYDPVSTTPTAGSGKPFFKPFRSRVKVRAVSDSDDGNLEAAPKVSPRNPKRQRTVDSLYNAATSIRDFAVSHFTVPDIAAPWDHEVSEKHGPTVPPSSSVRYFDAQRQRRRLFINSTFQWFVTAFLCAALAGCLYGFSTLITGLGPREKPVFNALVTGLSISLGLNLASSLRGYAQMMRWRFLASSYRTVQDFELVMNCDSQSKVFRLIWAGRTRGSRMPNAIQVIAVSWIFINLALQVFTALLGLTYSVDISPGYVTLDDGNVNTVILSYIGDDITTTGYANNYSTPVAKLAQLSVANELGVAGQAFSVWNTTFDDYFANEQSVYTDGDIFWYRFIDRSPLDNAMTEATYRTVNTTATCKSHPVTYGGYAGFQTQNDSLMWDVTWVDSDGIENTWWVPEQATGATTWMSNVTSDCGPRCNQVFALQVADNSTLDVDKPQFWSCYSYVSEVDGADEYPNPEQYRLPDEQAKVLAGAIGWSGIVVEQSRGVENTTDYTDPETQLEIVSYPVNSQWSPFGGVDAEEMASLVMQFTACAISALDTVGPRHNVTGYTPSPAQVINVQWDYAAAILGGIPFVQGLILLVVILCADKAIIKDTSHLSTARLLRPVVEKLGDKGCLLTGDEIAEELGNYRIIYGVRDPNLGIGNGMDMNISNAGDGLVRHLDILEESEGLGRRTGSMPEGRYDGLHPATKQETKRLLGGESDDSEEEREEVVQIRRRTKGRAKRRMSI